MWVAITGASSGLGQALAQALIEQGATLLTMGRRSVVLPQAKSDQHQHHSVDLACATGVQQAQLILQNALQNTLAQAQSSQSISTVLLINNAGDLGPIADYTGWDTEQTPQALQSLFMLNSIAPMALSATFVHTAQSCAPGVTIKVLNIASGAARHPYAAWGGYCASKAALDMATRVLRLEAPSAQVVSVAPGVVDTSMQAHIREAKHFPQHDKFQMLYQQGGLLAPNIVAQRLLAYCQSPTFAQHPLIDLRDLYHDQ